MKHILVRGVSLAAVMLAVPAPVLAAAGAAEAKAESANEIIVSARKREENVQDVPISITAISGEALERKGAVNFESLSFNNPNVKIATQSGVGPIAANIAIRGNIQSAGTLQVDPSVGVYVDGLLLAHTFGTAQLGVDVMSVQTLKGPQGTLFGRNTTGGAMLIRTRDPELGEVSGYVQGSYGELDTWRAGGAINIPVSEIAALRLVYQRNHSDDYEFFTDGRSLGRK
ncbi:MAG: TonB-dependent receptor plug domain-containing protein, partial [Novosphingobium sp.]|nr:TonB-dependent receptor plug domain-containing protein [Novosphingobium sp.]